MRDTRDALGLVVRVSGAGSNRQALLDAPVRPDPDFRVLAAGAGRGGTGGAERAQARRIPTCVAPLPEFVTRYAWDLDLARQFAAFEPDLVVSAWFMKVLGPAVHGGHRIVNTHPSLLPAFSGVDAVAQAIAHGVKVSGVTIHFVDTSLDGGPIIAQAAVAVFPADDSTTRHARIQAEEHRLLPEVGRRVAAGVYSCQGRHVVERAE